MGDVPEATQSRDIGPKAREGAVVQGAPAHPHGLQNAPQATPRNGCKHACCPGKHLWRRVQAAITACGEQRAVAAGGTAWAAPCPLHAVSLPAHCCLIPPSWPAGGAQGLHGGACRRAHPGAGPPLPRAGDHAELSVAGSSNSGRRAARRGGLASRQAKDAGGSRACSRALQLLRLTATNCIGHVTKRWGPARCLHACYVLEQSRLKKLSQLRRSQEAFVARKKSSETGHIMLQARAQWIWEGHPEWEDGARRTSRNSQLSKEVVQFVGGAAICSKPGVHSPAGRAASRQAPWHPVHAARAAPASAGLTPCARC